MALLQAKLRVPVARRELVPRARLLELLPTSAGALPPVILLAAPAGFGKTTLLAQWIPRVARGGLQTAWLGLDASDADPQHFLSHLVAAVQTIDPRIGVEAAALLDRPDGPVEVTLVSLINDLDLLIQPAVIVLDDCHLADGAGARDLLRDLVENLPPQVTIVISSREDPSLPLARLRVSGDLVELRAADLRFTVGEAALLLSQVVGSALPDEAVSAIADRTEGWAAGLQLAGLAARVHRSSGEVGEFVGAFTGSHRFVIDYLVDEVMNGLDAPVREFLLHTSILDELTGELCDAVTGGTEGRRMLQELERSGLFVIALDDRAEWFRYHHLFAVALRAQLQAAEPTRVPSLHRAAAIWLAEHDVVPDALAHASAADDDELTADILECALAGLRRTRQDRLLRERLEQLPDTELRRRALLATGAAWAALSRGELARAAQWLDAAEAAPHDTPLVNIDPPADLRRARDDEMSDLPAMVEVYRAAIAQARGDVDATRAHASRALSATTADRHLARAAANGYLGLAVWTDGDLALATDSFAEAIRSMRAAGNLADALGAVVVLAEMWRARGRADEARRLVRAALDDVDRVGAAAISSAGDLHVMLAALLVEHGELDEASEQLRIAQSLGDAGSFPENRYRQYVVAAAIDRARGRLSDASDALAEAAAHYLPGFLPDLQPISALRARVSIARGDLAAAAEWVREDGIRLDEERFARSCSLLTLVRLRIAQHREDATVDLAEAESCLARKIARASAEQALLTAESRMLRAIALDALDDRHAAIAELDAALRVADHGFARLFLDEAPAIGPLLAAIASGPDAGSARTATSLLGTSSGPSPDDPSADDPSPDERGDVAAAYEDLSAREREVLRLLVGDLTGPEIAAHLYVSVNTLRTHTKHIYTKLGVSTRRAAVRTATERGLI